jgi:RNA polymerase sigma factor (sigma-70 family)
VSSDARLVMAAQRGDAASLGILLERHRVSMYALALRILGRKPEAQDAVQDAFLVALSGIDRLRMPEAVGAWLHSILRNLCYTRLRKGGGEIPLDEPSTRAEARSSEPSAEEIVDRLALREWVWTALSKLPEDLRVTAMLRYFGSYTSYREIAAVLGVPVGTVGSRLSQVKTRLAEALLESAELGHSEARRLARSQTHHFAEVFDLYNRDRDYEAFLDPFAEDLVWAYPDGTVFRGLAHPIRVFESDLDSGMKMHPTNVLASKDVTVVEVDFENPSDDPLHCPPSTSFVYFYRGGRVHLLRQYYTPRPAKE